MKKAGSRILIITFGIMAAIAILYPWKFVPEYGILQMTESGEKAGKTAESQESDEEYMQVADRAVEALFTGDTDTLLSLLPERYFGQYGETLQWIIENAVEEEFLNFRCIVFSQMLFDEMGNFCFYIFIIQMGVVFGKCFHILVVSILMFVTMLVTVATIVVMFHNSL